MTIVPAGPAPSCVRVAAPSPRSEAESSHLQTRRFVIVAPWGTCSIDGRGMEIGREVGPLADELSSYMTVSRRHASLRVSSSGRLLVRDHNSSNGTFRNGRRINPNLPVELRDGDTVSLSTRVRFTVREESDEG